jgi:hypothetical protein
LETFCEYAVQYKLRGSTIFMILGHTNKNLWRNKKSGATLDRVDKCWNQPAWANYISPKRWATKRRRFEKRALRVPLLLFEPCPNTCDEKILHSTWSFEVKFFSFFFYNSRKKWNMLPPSYPTFGFLSYGKLNLLKIPQELLV